MAAQQTRPWVTENLQGKQRSLIYLFQPTHAYQVKTIPGIKDMIAQVQMIIIMLSGVLRPTMA